MIQCFELMSAFFLVRDNSICLQTLIHYYIYTGGVREHQFGTVQENKLLTNYFINKLINLL